MYTIVREKSFDEQVEIITRRHFRMKDLDHAIDWALSRKPTEIPNIVKISYEYYLWVTAEFYNIDIPMVKILYRVERETNTVYLFTIAEVKPNEEERFGQH